VCVGGLSKGEALVDMRCDRAVVDQRRDIREFLADALLSIAEEDRQDNEHDAEFEGVGVHGPEVEVLGRARFGRHDAAVRPDRLERRLEVLVPDRIDDDVEAGSPACSSTYVSTSVVV